MNAKQRTELDKMIGELEDIKSRLETMQESEQEKFDNLSEGLQQAESGQKIEQAASNLGDAVSEIESIIGYIETAKE